MSNPPPPDSTSEDKARRAAPAAVSAADDRAAIKNRTPQTFGIWLFVIILIADVLTKQWAQTSLANNPPLQLLPFLQFIYAENTGVSFGFFQSEAEATRWILVAVSTLISLVIIILIRRSEHALERLGWTCVLAGAVGNITDRIALGYVIDFIDFHWQSWHYPAFNIADSAITLGVLLVLWTLLFPPPPPAK